MVVLEVGEAGSYGLRVGWRVLRLKSGFLCWAWLQTVEVVRVNMMMRLYLPGKDQIYCQDDDSGIGFV